MGNCCSFLRRSRSKEPEAEVIILKPQGQEEIDLNIQSSIERYGRDEEPKPIRRLEKLIISPALSDGVCTTQSVVTDAIIPQADIPQRTQILSQPKFIVEDLFTTSNCTMFGIDSIKSEVAGSGERAGSKCIGANNSESEYEERERRAVMHRRWIRRKLTSYARKFVSSLTVNDPDSWTK